MLQLQYAVEPHTQTTVSPHVVVRSTLLELGYADLASRIEEELAQNPALDLNPDTTADLSPLHSAPPSDYSGSSHPGPANDSLPMSSVPMPQSLQDELIWQFHATAPASLHEIGDVLISAVDDDGYLSVDLFELAQDLDVPRARVRETLDYLQRLSPPGIGARSLRECLELQVRAKRESGEPVPDSVVQIISHFAAHYEDLEQQLTGATGLASDQVRAALDYIRRNLCPYPGQQFHADLPDQTPNHHVYPDAIIYYDGADLRVDIPQSQAGALRLNHAYLRLERLIQRQASDLTPEQAGAVQEQIRQARRFIQMLEQRRITMQLVTEAIVEKQKGLILHGVMALRPLTKKHIASLTGMHESTVSRATRHKYVTMPTGTLLPFDIFFEDALPAKALIAQTVQRENAHHPLTDHQLEEALAEHGYRLARRTVTKYRRQLGIPSSRHRRGPLTFTAPQLLT